MLKRCDSLTVRESGHYHFSRAKLGHMSNERLQKELATYEAHKQELVGQGEGQFVLIQDDKVVGIYATYGDALKVGYEKFKLDTPFLVKQISAIERVQFFTRDLSACRS